MQSSSAKSSLIYAKSILLQKMGADQPCMAAGEYPNLFLKAVLKLL